MRSRAAPTPSLHDLVVSDARRLAYEINNDVMAGEGEIASAIEAGFALVAERERKNAQRIVKRLIRFVDQGDWKLDDNLGAGPLVIKLREIAIREGML